MSEILLTNTTATRSNPLQSAGIQPLGDQFKMLVHLLPLLAIVALLQCSGILIFYTFAIAFHPRTLPMEPDGRRLLLSIPVALPLLGGVAQYLAWLRLYHWAFFIVLWLAGVLLFRRQVHLCLKDAAMLVRKIRESWTLESAPGALMWIALLVLLALILLRTALPTPVVDAYYYHLPIAEHLVEHRGFKLPVHDHPYYGSLPSFTDFLFSLGYLFKRDFQIAGLINFSVFASFLLWLASLSGLRRAAVTFSAVFLLLCFPEVQVGALGAMVDSATSIFSVAAIVMLVRFKEEEKTILLFSGGVMLGAAIASKYLALVTFLFCVPLSLYVSVTRPFNLHLTVRRLALFAVGASLVFAPWYLKNLYLFGNPVYPYLFAHPGISDEWMRQLIQEQTEAFNPMLRLLSRDITKTTSWSHLHLIVLYVIPALFAARFLAPVLSGLLFGRGRKPAVIVVLLAFGHMVAWYFFIFNTIRYGMTGFLLVFVGGYLALLALADRITLLKVPRTRRGLLAVFFLLAAVVTRKVITQDLDSARPTYDAYLRGDSRESLYRLIIPGSALYTYIVREKLEAVFYPYDGGAANPYIRHLYGSPRRGTFISIHSSATSPADIPKFLRRQRIEYFVLPPKAVREALAGRYDTDRLRAAQRVYDILQRGAQLILRDSEGFALYRVSPTALQGRAL